MCGRLDSYLKSRLFHKNSNTSDGIIEFLNYVYSSLIMFIR